MQTMNVATARAAVAEGAVISASIQEAPAGAGWTLSLSKSEQSRFFVETTRSRALKIYRRIDAAMNDVAEIGLKTANVVLSE